MLSLGRPALCNNFYTVSKFLNEETRSILTRCPPIPMAVRYQALICSYLIAEIACSNLGEIMDVLLSCYVFCRWRPLRRVDHSFRVFLPGLCL